MFFYFQFLIVGLEKERAKLRAGQAPAEAKVKIVQWTIFVTRVRVVPLWAQNENNLSKHFLCQFCLFA